MSSPLHQSSCPQVVPERNQSEMELHFARFRHPIRRHVSDSTVCPVSASWKPVPLSRPGAPPAAPICGSLGPFTAAGRPLLRRRLRKVVASRLALRVRLVPCTHQPRLPSSGEKRRRRPVSRSLARTAFRREMPPPPQQQGL